jgi:hypothetical protein
MQIFIHVQPEPDYEFFMDYPYILVNMPIMPDKDDYIWLDESIYTELEEKINSCRTSIKADYKDYFHGCDTIDLSSITRVVSRLIWILPDNSTECHISVSQ